MKEIISLILRPILPVILWTSSSLLRQLLISTIPFLSLILLTGSFTSSSKQSLQLLHISLSESHFLKNNIYSLSFPDFLPSSQSTLFRHSTSVVLVKLFLIRFSITVMLHNAVLILYTWYYLDSQWYYRWLLTSTFSK